MSEYRSEVKDRVPKCGDRRVERGGAHVLVMTTDVKYYEDGMIDTVEIVTKNALGERKTFRSISAFEAKHDPVPAPPVSRWLDPASVPVGAKPMRLCAFGSKARDTSYACSFPAIAPREYARLDTDPYLWCNFHSVRDDHGKIAAFPPSALTPAPRWRSLRAVSGCLWAKPCRVLVFDIFCRHSDEDEREDEVGGRGMHGEMLAYGSRDLRTRQPKTPRVRKVIAQQLLKAQADAAGLQPIKWIFA